VLRLITTLVHDHGTIHGLVNKCRGQFPATLAAINQKGSRRWYAPIWSAAFWSAARSSNQSMEQTGGVSSICRRHVGRPCRHGPLGRCTRRMDNFTRQRVEWAHAGVTVNAVAPGWIRLQAAWHTYDGAMKAIIRA